MAAAENPGWFRRMTSSVKGTFGYGNNSKGNKWSPYDGEGNATDVISMTVFYIPDNTQILSIKTRDLNTPITVPGIEMYREYETRTGHISRISSSYNVEGRVKKAPRSPRRSRPARLSVVPQSVSQGGRRTKRAKRTKRSKRTRRSKN